MRSSLLLAVAILIGGGCSGEPVQNATPSSPGLRAAHPQDASLVDIVLFVICPENAYPYADETLARFRKLVEGGGWRDPAWNAQGTLEVVHEKTGLTFVLVPAGSGLIGSDVDYDTLPVERVTVPGFLLSKTEATEAAWLTVETAPPDSSVSTLMPVRWVDWYLVKGWCEDAGLRLPTEREWEYACRAGTSTSYFFGERSEGLDQYGWFDSNSDFEVHEVAGLRANPWGFHDMYGNVAEWCLDRHGGERYWRVLRGGWMFTIAERCRSSSRDGTFPTSPLDWIGFRPAASLSPK